ncbi:MAG: hypothetical protein ACUVUC_16540, partial [Thermoguttaceae bacterium]
MTLVRFLGAAAAVTVFGGHLLPAEILWQDGKPPASSVTVAPIAPAGAPRVDEPFDYFRNSWNVIGLKDYQRGARVTPDNRLLLADGEARIHFGKDLAPLSRRQIKTLLAGWMPIVLLAADDGPVHYEFTLWATPLPTVKDWEKAFDWPTEGENFLNWIRVKATNKGPTSAGAKLCVVQTAKGTSATHALAWSLEPGASAEGAVRIPFFPVQDTGALARADHRLWLQRTMDFWQTLMASAARIEVPERKATDTLRAAHVCQLIASDRGVLKAGEGFYDEFYIRDGAYQVMELEEAGLWDAAQRAIDHYLKCQRPDGRFESQKD